MDGRPVPILIKNEATGNFDLDERALSNILLRPEVQDKPVCVLAVAGAFRQGKSFLLNFLLRYCKNKGKTDWMGDSMEPLEGFSWSRSNKRETTGIVAWSEPFLFKRHTGEEIAVVLLDTQGTFDTQASMSDSIIVFSLSMVVSSVLVYNLMHKIQEDDLMNLQTFTSIAVQSQQQCDTSHSFQRIQFLVRDWGFPSQVPYGNGQAELDDILEITPTMHQSHRDVRRDLRKCFQDINCYLMPDPGSSVIRMKKFDGKVADMDKDFTKHLSVLVPLLLAPNNLVTKEFGGKTLNGRDLLKLFKDFTESIKENDLSEAFFHCTARASSQVALKAGREQYKEAMNTLVVGVQNFSTTQEMESIHIEEKKRSVQLYLEVNKYGKMNPTIMEEYKEMLEEEIEGLFKKFAEVMEDKSNGAAQNSSQVALKAGKEQYNETMGTIVVGVKNFLTMKEMESIHVQEKKRSLQLYLEENKYGKVNENILQEYKEKLENDLEILFGKFAGQMEDKNNNQAQNSSQNALNAGKDYYYESAKKLVIGSTTFPTMKDVEQLHVKEKKRAVEIYLEENSHPWINEEIKKKFQVKLEQEIDKLYVTLCEQREIIAKNNDSLSAQKKEMEKVFHNYGEERKNMKLQLDGINEENKVMKNELKEMNEEQKARKVMEDKKKDEELNAMKGKLERLETEVQRSKQPKASLLPTFVSDLAHIATEAISMVFIPKLASQITKIP